MERPLAGNVARVGQGIAEVVTGSRVAIGAAPVIAVIVMLFSARADAAVAAGARRIGPA